MSNWFRLVLNENMKIYRRPRTWAMTAFLLAAVIAFGILTKTVDTSGGPHDALAFMNVAANLAFLVFIFAVVVAADIVAGEFTWGTIKLLLIRPVSRSKVLGAKYAAALLFLLFLLAVLLFGSFAVGLALYGMPDAATGKAVTMGGILQDYGFRLIHLVINVTFAFMISTVFRSSALAISLAFIIMFTSNSIMALMIALKYEWAKYILFANTDLSVYFGRGKPPFEDMTLGFSVTMLLLYYALFVGLAWYMFRKRDVAG